MFDVGFSEIFFLGIIVIIVLGPEKLPELIRTLARIKSKVNIYKQQISSSLENELELHQLKEELHLEIANVKNIEDRLQQYLKDLEKNHLDHIFKYYPIEFFKIYVPYNGDFLLKHLMQWSCFYIEKQE